MEKRELLANKISEFLKIYAKKNNNDSYVGPDAYCMEKAQFLIMDSSVDLKDVVIPNSEVYSGCYKRNAEVMHDDIMKDFLDILKKKCSKCNHLIELEFVCCPYCGTKQ